MSIISEIQEDLDRGAMRLISEYRDRLFAEALKLCDNVATAEDLVSRTIDQAVRRIGDCSGDEKLFAWMKAILTNLYRNDGIRAVNRGTKPVEPEEIERMAGSDERTMDEVLLRSDLDALRNALDRLDPEYRKAIALYYFNNLSLKEVARLLNTSKSSVSRKLQLAREILAAKLTDKGGKTKPLTVLLGILLSAGLLFGAYRGVEAIVDVLSQPSATDLVNAVPPVNLFPNPSFEEVVDPTLPACPSNMNSAISCFTDNMSAEYRSLFANYNGANVKLGDEKLKLMPLVTLSKCKGEQRYYELKNYMAITNAHSGEFFLYQAQNGTGVANKRKWTVSLDLEPGDYNLSFYAAGAAAGNSHQWYRGSIWVEYIGPDGAAARIDKTFDFTSPNQWTLCELSFKATGTPDEDKTTVPCKLRFNIDAAENAVKAGFFAVAYDDFFLAKVAADAPVEVAVTSEPIELETLSSFLPNYGTVTVSAENAVVFSAPASFMTSDEKTRGTLKGYEVRDSSNRPVEGLAGTATSVTLARSDVSAGYKVVWLYDIQNRIEVAPSAHGTYTGLREETPGCGWGWYDYGENVSLTAIPDYWFLGWKGAPDYGVISKSYTFKAVQPVLMTPVFTASRRDNLIWNGDFEEVKSGFSGWTYGLSRLATGAWEASRTGFSSMAPGLGLFASIDDIMPLSGDYGAFLSMMRTYERDQVNGICLWCRVIIPVAGFYSFSYDVYPHPGKYPYGIEATLIKGTKVEPKSQGVLLAEREVSFYGGWDTLENEYFEIDEPGEYVIKFGVTGWDGVAQDWRARAEIDHVSLRLRRSRKSSGLTIMFY